MEEPDLIEPFVDMANSHGEDLNDGDEWPGWMTAEWVENPSSPDGYDLEITYENTDNEKVIQRYRVERVRD